MSLTPSQKLVAAMSIPDLIKEMNLIAQKKSDLPAMMRHLIKLKFVYLVKRGEIKIK